MVDVSFISNRLLELEDKTTRFAVRSIHVKKMVITVLAVIFTAKILQARLPWCPFIHSFIGNLLAERKKKKKKSVKSFFSLFVD